MNCFHKMSATTAGFKDGCYTYYHCPCPAGKGVHGRSGGGREWEREVVGEGGSGGGLTPLSSKALERI